MQCVGCQEWEDEDQGTGHKHELSWRINTKTDAMPAEWGGGEGPWDSENVTQALLWSAPRA